MAKETKWEKGTAGSIVLASPDEIPIFTNSVVNNTVDPRVVRGVIGHIRWHYHIAAEVQGYTVVPSGERWALSCQLVAQDAFKMSQRPLTFVALLVKPRDLGGGVYGQKTEWRWPLVSFSLADGGRLTATLGALE